MQINDLKEQARKLGYKLVKISKEPCGNASVEWSQAPDWANWWIMDSSGLAFWCKQRPKLEEDYFLFKSNYVAEKAPEFGYSLLNWNKSLTKRAK